ncbi:MAG: HAD family hydrolase [Novosphingobium sp.]
MIRAVVFDVGETLVDETRQWGMWADWLKVPHLTFFAAFGAVVARGEHHRKVLDYFAPGIDLEHQMHLREAAGLGYRIELEDFYPDAMPCLSALRSLGYVIGIAGNQPETAEAALKSCDVPADFVASSARWKIEKPSPRFFEKLLDETGLRPGEIAYVGDRLDNDILPAVDLGMFGVFIERGPWGVLHARKPEAMKAHVRIRTLAELPDVLAPCPA